MAFRKKPGFLERRTAALEKKYLGLKRRMLRIVALHFNSPEKTTCVNHITAECECECGVVVLRGLRSVVRGFCYSCGCKPPPNKRVKPEGHIYIPTGRSRGSIMIKAVSEPRNQVWMPLGRYCGALLENRDIMPREHERVFLDDDLNPHVSPVGKIAINCDWCGATYFTLPNQAARKKKSGHFCSKECACKGIGKHHEQAAKVELTCDGCGKLFIRKKCVVDQYQKRGLQRSFCSRDCFVTSTTIKSRTT